MTWGAGDWRACQKSEPGGLLLIDKVKEGTQKTEKFLQMHFKKEMTFVGEDYVYIEVAEFWSKKVAVGFPQLWDFLQRQ